MAKKAGIVSVSLNTKGLIGAEQRAKELIQKNLTEGVMNAADIVKEDAADNIHRVEKRGWSMQDHITTELIESTPDFVRVRIGPDKKAFWGLFVEFGHALVRGKGKNKAVVGHVPPHPFLRPALEENSDEIIKAIQKSIGEIK